MAEALKDFNYPPFGKYAEKGEDPRPLVDIPSSYFLYLYDKDDGLWQQNHPFIMPLKLYIEENWESLLMDEPDYLPKHKPIKPI